MKKIILILALLSLGVSKAQVVGGYLPLNSTKSATMGGLKVAGNETVTGTFSVGSTATITGALKASSTMSLGSANLTGGNTGTVAVLSDAVFPITLNQAQCNPSDAGTFYIGNLQGALVNNSSYGLIKLPYNCILVGWDLNWYGVPGTSETSTLSINGTTNYTLTSTATFSNASAIGTFSANGLSQNFSANDVLNIKWVTPTWATNPTAFFIGITLWFVRRS